MAARFRCWPSKLVYNRACVRQRSWKGFTLIELMIVVAVIGILASVAIPKFADMLRKSKEGSTKGGLTNLRSALRIYISDNEGYVFSAGVSGAPTRLDALVPRFLEALPTAKLGRYHEDTDQVVTVADVVDRGATAALYDQSGWIYTSSDGGVVFVDCIHTDTKNASFTNW